jgi:transcriptional regulator with XRE-family HTH domain
MVKDGGRLGDRLKQARQRRHLTQVKVAELLGKTHAAIGQWERGETVPELASLVAAAELYEVSVDWIVWGGEMSSGIEARIKRVPEILRAALVERLHKEIDETEEAAKRLPSGMVGDAVRDRDPRLSGWSASRKVKAKSN